MKSLSKGLSTLTIIIGLVLFALTNSGLLTFGGSYLHRFADNLPEPDPVTAFVDVNVLPMDSQRAMQGQTVIVRDGIIAEVGDRDQVTVPAGARLIDGRGGYLIPGLVDMHIHIEYENDLLLLAANGVTSVRNMWGNTGRKLWFGLPDQLALRVSIEFGELYGPTIYANNIAPEV